ncbi:hypothetical protein [Falsiruegeria litorea]|uniref:hypothetical protein n=1 Tax=Falsiruegeria litorea TaxID=1280831 RepID=UPI001F29058A|nr:hypothetical protein [Falsiruegeria litorea]
MIGDSVCGPQRTPFLLMNCWLNADAFEHPPPVFAAGAVRRGATTGAAVVVAVVGLGATAVAGRVVTVGRAVVVRVVVRTVGFRVVVRTVGAAGAAGFEVDTTVGSGPGLGLVCVLVCVLGLGAAVAVAVAVAVGAVGSMVISLGFGA